MLFIPRLIRTHPTPTRLLSPLSRFQPRYLRPFSSSFQSRLSSMTSTPLLPLTREASTASLTLSRTSPPSRVRLGRFSPGHLSLTRRYSSPPPHSPISTDQPTSLSGRLKLLIKSYGWYALGVYAVIGLFDFGLAFGLVHLLGAEQMSKWSAQAKALITDLIHPTDPNAPASDGVETAPKGGNEGLVAMLLIAYTVHKTLFLPSTLR